MKGIAGVAVNAESIEYVARMVYQRRGPATALFTTLTALTDEFFNAYTSSSRFYLIWGSKHFRQCVYGVAQTQCASFDSVV